MNTTKLMLSCILFTSAMALRVGDAATSVAKAERAPRRSTTTTVRAKRAPAFCAPVPKSLSVLQAREALRPVAANRTRVDAQSVDAGPGINATINTYSDGDQELVLIKDGDNVKVPLQAEYFKGNENPDSFNFNLAGNPMQISLTRNSTESEKSSRNKDSEMRINLLVPVKQAESNLGSAALSLQQDFAETEKLKNGKTNYSSRTSALLEGTIINNDASLSFGGDVGVKSTIGGKTEPSAGAFIKGRITLRKASASNGLCDVYCNFCAESSGEVHAEAGIRGDFW